MLCPKEKFIRGIHNEKDSCGTTIPYPTPHNLYVIGD